MKKLLIIMLSLSALAFTLSAAGCYAGGETDKLLPSVSDGNLSEQPSPENTTPPNGSNQTPDSPPAEENPAEQPEDTTDVKNEKNEVVFTAENFEFTIPYEIGDETIDEPDVPEKFGYSGKWENYVLSGGKITVNPVYTLKEFKIIFAYENFKEERVYTVENSEITLPQVPAKRGYTGEWNCFELSFDQPVIVGCTYTAVIYKITFVAENFTSERTYTIEDSSVEPPKIPQKDGYTSEWQPYELTYGEDMTVNAVYAISPYTSDESFMWELNEDGNGYVISKYVGTDKEVVIPLSHENLPVIEIGQSAFASADITDVTFPTTLKIIGESAFCDCALENLAIPDYISEIGAYAFKKCEQLKSVDTGDGLKVIREETFKGCLALKSVRIGLNIETIGINAFADCLAIETAVFTDAEYWYDHHEGALTPNSFTPSQMTDAAWAARLLYVGCANTIFKRKN